VKALDPPVAGWKAQLAVEYRRHGGRTVLASRCHDGPLVVQKPFYPEGEAVCHTIVVHPPGGIAGGDQLRLSAAVGEGAAALLTTPGAAKWYRSEGVRALQHVSFEVHGSLEWLPQETIVYSGALAAMQTDVRLARNASYLAWEILCLGRTGSGERFLAGQAALATRIWRDGTLLWNERGEVDAGGALLQSPAGLSGRTVCGTLLAAGGIDAATLASCRSAQPVAGEAAVSRLPGLVVARYLGDSSEAAKRYFAKLWTILRPALLQREAVAPRIWNT
jgi:urease accessory protein